MNAPIDIKVMSCGDLSDNIFCNIGQILTSTLNPKEVFKRVMTVIGDYFSPRNWSLLLMETNTGRLKFEIAMGIDNKKIDNVFLEKGEGIAGWVAQNGKPLVVPDVTSDPRFSSRMDEILGFATRSVVCVPLLNGSNRVVGVIELINRFLPPGEMPECGDLDIGVFTETDMEILGSIGVFTGIAAENAFLHQRVKELAIIDPLTGVYNRHYFNEIFEREEERIRRYSYPVCVLMMDLDGLKQINDIHGHLAGDKALRTIADILKSSIRESDVLARFGGDEFVLLMPHSDESRGLQVAARIQDMIKKWNMNSTRSDPKLGLSIGVHAAGPDNMDNMLIKADQELYKYKKFKKDPAGLTSEEEMRRYLWENFLEEGSDETDETTGFG
ncbi:MAG: sensor domain-containing diguanylate cyclase [Deltaproteobacteria bacterium]|nr:sensor domain-containing diguanylate cyclase [Deltaproteobacteria bacterium]